MILINIIGLACLSFLFAVGAEPIQWIKEIFCVGPEDKYYNKIQWVILKLINCSLCSGFWIGLIFTQSIILAGIISILAEYITIKLTSHNG